MIPASIAHPEEHAIADAAATIYLVSSTSDRLTEARQIAAWMFDPQSNDASRVSRGIHPDVIELLPLEGKQRIGIAQVREVIRAAQFAPTEADHKICLIPLAEALTIEAANALLKTLEEPPRGLRFILLVDHPADLLPTIVSRSRLLRIPAVSQASIIADLVEAGYSEPHARWLVRLPLRDGDLARLAKEPEDIDSALKRTAHLLEGAKLSDLVDLSLGEDPILRQQAMLCLLERVARRDGDFLSLGIRILASQPRETLTRFLHELLRVAFDLVRATAVPSAVPDELANRVRQAFGLRDLHSFCLAINEANRSLTVYGPTEGVLLSLFLTSEGDDLDT
jgi:hypothetical protein